MVVVVVVVVDDPVTQPPSDSAQNPLEPNNRRPVDASRPPRWRLDVVDHDDDDDHDDGPPRRERRYCAAWGSGTTGRRYTMSTRRFVSRPCRVLLSAIGSASPLPSAVIRSLGTPSPAM